MLLFLSQYYKGLGHSNRIRLIAEECQKHTPTIVVEQLFMPPFKYNVSKTYSLLNEIKLPKINNIYKFIQKREVIQFRIKEWIRILNSNDIKVIVIEGFPFCRHQFAFEYLKYLEEAKKRGIKIVFSIRDYPWDEPHDTSLQDWVANTQNLIVKHYAEKVLIHGDNKILPLTSDTVRMSNPAEIIQNIESQLYYTGYVLDKSLKRHKKENNHIYVSCGMNKEESLVIFKRIIEVADKFKDYKFILSMGDESYDKPLVKDNITLVKFIPELSKKISSCSLFITYGGYNSTMEILQTQCPSIIIPRENGLKQEQKIRAYAFEYIDCFKVCPTSNLKNIDYYIEKALTEHSFPKKFPYSRNGTENSSNFLKNLLNEY